MQRKGKIARLPRALRHELNRRLADNEDGGVTLNWLNALPEVKAVLARDLAADAEELDAATNGKLLDGMATALSVRYAATLASWDGNDHETIRGQLRILRSFTQDIVALRRCQQGAARLKIDQIPFEREEKKLADAEVQAKIDEERRVKNQSYLEAEWRRRKLAEAQAAAVAPVAASPATATAATAAARQPADRNVPPARAV